MHRLKVTCFLNHLSYRQFSSSACNMLREGNNQCPILSLNSVLNTFQWCFAEDKRSMSMGLWDDLRQTLNVGQNSK